MRLHLRWWLTVVVTGAAAGVVGIGITALLHAVQHASFGYTENTFLVGVEEASPQRRVVVLVIAGAVTGVGWWLLRSRAPGRTIPDALLQVVVVGLGASLGREGAPRQVAGAFADWLGRRAGLDPGRQRVLVACGAAAGLAAVYNVPVGGAVFAAEVLLGSLSWRVLLPAAVTSGLATAVSWLTLPNRPTYAVGDLHPTWWLLTFAVVAGPVLAAAGTAFSAVMGWARRRPLSSWRILPAALAVFAALGALAIPYPQLLGNGKGPAELALTGSLGAGLATILAVLKPLSTAACLRSGAAGGLLTPAVATGALIGAVGGQLWPGGQAGGYAFVAAGAMIAVTQRAPWCALALMAQFTDAPLVMLAPLAVAIAGAMLCVRSAGARRSRRGQSVEPGRVLA